MKNINVEISDELHRKLMIACAEGAVTQKELVPELLEKGLSLRKKGNSDKN